MRPRTVSEAATSMEPVRLRSDGAMRRRDRELKKYNLKKNKIENKRNEKYSWLINVTL